MIDVPRNFVSFGQRLKYTRRNLKKKNLGALGTRMSLMLLSNMTHPIHSAFCAASQHLL